MRYVKKTCILRQLKSGFSADGKALSGIIKAEQYANNVGVEISVSNLANTSSGEYYLILSDAERRYRLLPLEKSTRCSFVSEMQLAEGFYAVLCFFAGAPNPIAYGVCGNLPYDIFTLVRKVFSASEKDGSGAINAHLPPTNSEIAPLYNDELLAGENYYEKEDARNDEIAHTQNSNDAPLEGGNPHQGEAERCDSKPNEDDACVRHAFGTETDGYYQSVKGELAALFERYPTDDSLTDAYPASEWVRVKGEKETPQQLVGIIYESGLAKYICYAVPATEDAPQDIKDKAFFVPVSPLTPQKGFYVLYQSAATGEHIVKQEC